MVGLSLPEAVSVQHNYLTFEYKKQNYSVPIASSVTDFKELYHQRTLPQLNAAVKNCENSTDRADIAFSRFYYPGDDLDEQSPQAATALREFFKFAGAPVSNTPIKIDRWMPTRSSMLEWMKKNPEHYIPLKDFLESSFIISPAIVHDKQWVTFKEDADTISSDLSGGVLIDGRTIVDFIQPDSSRDRIYFDEISTFLDSMASPISYVIDKRPQQA